MTLQLSSIRLDGAALALDEVSADVVIRHGRADAYDAAEAATCQLVLLGVDKAFARAFHTGARLEVGALDSGLADALAGELTVNGGAESGALGPWSAVDGCTVTADQAKPHDGAWSFKCTTPGGHTYTGVNGSFGAPIVIPAGTLLRAEGWIWVPPEMAGKLCYLQVHDGAAYPVNISLNAVSGWNKLAAQGRMTQANQYVYVASFVQDAPANVPLWIDELSATAPGEPRFTGRVTDGALDVDELTAIAVGGLSTLSQYVVGAVDWPSEAWSARVSRAFAEAGLAALLDLVVPPVDPILAARVSADDGGPVALDGYLGELAAMIGAAVVDLPDGRILVQPLSARSLAAIVPLDPDEVEWAPAWVQVLPQANRVTVKWVGGEEIAEDAGSIAIYGVIPDEISTTFADAQAARDRASERLGRTARPHWNIPSAPLTVGRGYAIGAPVELTGMPAASPFDPWTPVLEGWTDTISAERGALSWRMELALSDPLASGLTLPWQAVPPADHWNTIAPAVTWAEALTLDALETA